MKTLSNDWAWRLSNFPKYVADSSITRIPLQLSRDCIVASIQIDLTEEVLQRFRPDLLAFVQSTGARGVILDLSGLEILDLQEFEELRRTILMVELMGAQPVISGLRPGVVSSLIALDADVDGIQAAFNLDDAYRLIEGFPISDEEIPEEEQTDEFEQDPDTSSD